MDIKNYLFSFQGRINRQQYWTFFLPLGLLVFIPTIFIFGMSTPEGSMYVNIVSLIFIWPGLAIQAKRWHDRDKSAWWILINFIPLIGPIWALIENGCLAGTAGENRFDNLIESNPGNPEA